MEFPFPEVRSVEVARIEPGDHVVVTYPGQVSEQVAKKIEAWASKTFDGVKAVVLGDGGTLKVVRRASLAGEAGPGSAISGRDGGEGPEGSPGVPGLDGLSSYRADAYAGRRAYNHPVPKISVLVLGDRLDFEGEATVEQLLQILDRFFQEIDDPEGHLAKAKDALNASSGTLEAAVKADQPAT